ncbi:alpha/beta hydrolase [Steroidobacter sp. S1-65]|uniref:Alpha/beta hydrolase n=1 Tax=Steroidobacter gossypii TaxID=2805490 RepID=A0ABS1WR17_9GAMM|nr:alpha/beta hydrolase [Steroidobacter gossypii]MBM0103412.1 alpha/beta hydrolase [Steroidobacter gossypii]
MSYQTPAIDSARGADLDPEVRQFVTKVSQAFASYPDFNNLPLSEMRRACEQVRAPWAVGGPTMAQRQERSVSTPSGDVRVRIHNPSKRASKPALIYMHGGGWTTFSIDTHDRLMREYAARADVVVIGVDYALSPEVKFPVAQQQVAAVVRWARRHGAEFNIDGDRIALGGDSAGGNLAITTALRLRDEGESNAVRAVATAYAVTDTHSAPQALQRYGHEGYMLGADEMAGFWNNYLNSPDEARNPLVCPVHADLRGLPPVFMVIPECDILTEQNWRLADQLEQAGVQVTTSFYPGASHSFLEAMSISAISNRAIDDTARWLREILENAGC